MRRSLTALFVLCLTSPMLGQWSFVQKNGKTATRDNNITIAFSSSKVTKGHFIMVVTLVDRGLAVGSVCDGSGSRGCTDSDTFTSIQIGSQSNGINMSLWCAPVTATGGQKPTINVTFNSNFRSAAVNIAEYANLASCAKDASSANSNALGSGSTLTGSPITTTHNGDLILVWICSERSLVSIIGGTDPIIRLTAGGAFGEARQPRAGTITMAAGGGNRSAPYGFITAAFPPKESTTTPARGKSVVF